VLLLPVVLFFVALMTFVLMHLTPGGPWDREKPLAPAALANLNAKYHLDRPAPEQFLSYLWNAGHGDFGVSYRYPDRNVSEIIGEGLRTTATLGGLALAVALALGLPLGVVAALKRNTPGDYGSMLLAVVGYSMPSFVLATLGVILFAAVWHLLPSGGWGSPKEWIMPSLALGLGPAAAIARYTRASLLEIVAQDYVRTARAKGLGEGAVVGRHELRNALLPVVTILGPTMAYLVTGSFVIEEVFHVPGIGRNFIESVLSRDYPMIMASILLYAFAVAVANLLVDVAYAALDPRIRVSA